MRVATFQVFGFATRRLSPSRCALSIKMCTLSRTSFVCALALVSLLSSAPLLVEGALREHHALSGSCREAGLCCEGRDASCVVQKARVNSIVEDLGDRACYCDSACLAVGDCCHDYSDHCRGK